MEQISEGLLHRLTWPEGRVDAVLDTDTYNEIDDQYALSYLFCCGEKINVKAVYAAPFSNQKSSGPMDGMEKSYEEILRLLSLLGRADFNSNVYRGSGAYLPDETAPVISDAASHLVSLAASYTPEQPLYVIAIGAITNVASAILLDPSIRERIVIIWLGGHAHNWPHNLEFNCLQDVAAARVVFGSGAALVQLPCMGVVSACRTTHGELEEFLRGKNALCDYLADITERDGKLYSPHETWSRVIWDVTAAGWLVDRRFMKDYLTPAPIPGYDNRYSFDPTRHLMRYVYDVDRDALFEDVFGRLGALQSRDVSGGRFKRQNIPGRINSQEKLKMV